MTVSNGSQLDMNFEFLLNKPSIVAVTIENTLNMNANHVAIEFNIDYRVQIPYTSYNQVAT